MLTAADVMTTEVVTVTPDTPVREIAALLLAKRISGVPVMRPDGTVAGIVSEGDLIGHAAVIGEPRRSWWLRLFEHSETAQHYVRSHGRLARDVMTAPAICVAPETPVDEIASMLVENAIKRLPVVREGRLVGIVTRSNLLQALATADVSQPASTDDRAIRERLMAELDGKDWAAGAKNILVQDGVVHLWGFVSNEDERHALVLAAENVAGARGVEDHLQRYAPPIGGSWS